MKFSFWILFSPLTKKISKKKGVRIDSRSYLPWTDWSFRSYGVDYDRIFLLCHMRRMNFLRKVCGSKNRAMYIKKKKYRKVSDKNMIHITAINFKFFIFILNKL